MSTTYSSLTVSNSDVLSSFKTIKPTKEQKVINLSSLEKAARTLEDKAESVLSKDRLINTARRARMADSVEGQARKDIQLANTILRLIEGIKAGQTTYLSKIRAKTQVEILQYNINYAKNRRASKLRLPEWERQNKPVQEEDAEYASYPYPWLDIYSCDKLFALEQTLVGLVDPLSKLKAISGYDSSKAITFDTPEKLALLEIIIKELKASSKSEASRLIEHINNSMVDYQRLCQIDIPDLPTLIEALKEYCYYCSDIVKEDPIKKLERDLVGCKIPGYFPTPKIVVQRMLQLSNIDASMTVLEPSAGKGNIIDVIKETYPNCNLSVLEVNYTLREILKAKGYNLVGNDFLEHKACYDRIIMNPPFSGFQDLQHIQYAYRCLNPRGRLVSIVSESCFFSSTKQAVEFRKWLEEVNAYVEKLPDGSFLESERSTGVSTRIIVIDKPIISMDYIDLIATDVEKVQESLSQALSEISNEIAEMQESFLEVAEQTQIAEVTAETVEIQHIDPSAEVDKGKSFDATLHIHDYETIKDKFLEHQESYNTIIINPQVHSSQDIEHIYHAYYLLNPGGSLAVTLPNTVLATNNKLYSQFNKWLQRLKPTTETLSDGKSLVMLKKTTLF